METDIDYSQGISGDGPCILQDGLPMTPDEIVDRLENLTDKLRKINDWCGAYPVKIFPEPDFEKMAKVLKDNGMTIDSIGASSMRHVLKGIVKIIEGD